MIILVLSNLLATFFAFLESLGFYKNGLKTSFIVIFIFLALRFDYGNDYIGYHEVFLNFSKFPLFNGTNFDLKGFEIGWPLLNWVFNAIFGAQGFFLMIAFLSGLNCFVFYRLIKKHVNYKFYWFAIFYYTFNYELLLIMSSAMRQSVALLFFLMGFEYIIERKLFKYLLVIIIASTFHTSAVFLFLLYFILNPSIKVNLIILIFVLILVIISFYYSNVILESIFKFTLDNIDFYSIYEFGDFEERSFSIGTLISILIWVILYIKSIKKINIKMINFTSKIMLILILIYPLGIINPMINRFNYFLIPLLLIGFSSVYIESKKIFNIIYFSFVASFIIYTFYVFHNNSIYAPYFKEYKSILQFLTN